MSLLEYLEFKVLGLRFWKALISWRYLNNFRGSLSKAVDLRWIDWLNKWILWSYFVYIRWQFSLVLHYRKVGNSRHCPLWHKVTDDSPVTCFLNLSPFGENSIFKLLNPTYKKTLGFWRKIEGSLALLNSLPHWLWWKKLSLNPI